MSHLPEGYPHSYLDNPESIQMLFGSAPDAIILERFDPPFQVVDKTLGADDKKVNEKKVNNAQAARPSRADYEKQAKITYANPAFWALLQKRGWKAQPGQTRGDLTPQFDALFDDAFKSIWLNRSQQQIDNLQLSAHYLSEARTNAQLMLSTAPIIHDGFAFGCWTRITDATPAVVQDVAERRAMQKIDAFVRTENVPLICLQFKTPVPKTVPGQQLGLAYFGATITHITDSAAALFDGDPDYMLNKTVSDLNSTKVRALLENAFEINNQTEELNLGETASLLINAGGEGEHTFRIKPTFVFDGDYAVEAWVRIEDATREEHEARRLQTLEQSRSLAMSAASLHQFEANWKEGKIRIDPDVIESLDLAPLPADMQEWASILTPETVSISAGELEDIFNNHTKEVNFVARLPKKDGSTSHIEVWGLPDPNPAPQQRATTIGLFRDVTQSKTLQDRLSEKKTLEGLGVLAGGVAHDFNNLLMSVLGYAELMEADLMEAAGRNSAQLQHSALQNISEIRSAALRASELCTSLLAYAGQHLIEKKTLDITELVRSTSELVEVTIGKQVPFLLQLDNVIRVSADRGQLTRVIVNLVGNAADAMKGYTGAITVGASTLVLTPDEQALVADQLEQPGERLACITVRDQGCGMSPETQKRIYEPFFTTKDEGRGLGMAAVHGIVKNHGGAILVRTAEDQGTEFRVFLPLLASLPTAEHPMVTSNSKPGKEDMSGRPLVLVVDDDGAVRTIAAEMLRHLGCDVQEAESGSEALALFSENRFHYALLDITMPDMSGSELAELLLEKRPDLNVVLCSGYTEKNVPESLISRCSFIHKPFTLKEISDTFDLKSAMGDQTVKV